MESLSNSSRADETINDRAENHLVDFAASASSLDTFSASSVMPQLRSDAIVFRGDRKLDLQQLSLCHPQPDDVVVDIEWSGVSTGTERLMWSGEMPSFPGMGYPLVPGYEAVGRVRFSEGSPELIGRRVFVPGSRGFEDAKGLFGAAASRLVVGASRVVCVPEEMGEASLLLALAATARHAIGDGALPDLIIGHGVLGRLLARIAIAMGGPPPVVWEINPERADSDEYPVLSPDIDGRTDYKCIHDVSGDPGILDSLVGVMAPRGEIVLAGFYSSRVSFNFPPVFMKEARIRAAAEWKREDLDHVLELWGSGKLQLDDLITHRFPAADAQEAYNTAFTSAACLKLSIDWRDYDRAH